MDRHDRLTLALVLVALAGCGHRAGEPTDERVFTPPPHAATVAEERQQAARVLDEQGQLLPSTEFAGGVRLPRGLTATPELGNAQRHVFTTHVAPDKLAAYFGPLLVTGAVTRVGQGVVYHGATVRGSTSRARIDVSILPAGVGQVRVDITELSASDEHPLTEAQARELLHRPVD